MRNALIPVILLVVLVASIILATLLLFNKINKTVAQYENKIGEKVILKTDTLMIIDYSIWESDFTLEDGRKIKFKLFDKLENIDKTIKQ